MNTQELFRQLLSSEKINESLHKTFGKKLNLETFNLEQLQDARNRIRTQLSQIRNTSGFNETIENEAYTEAQWMLDAINAEIAERDEFIIDDVKNDDEDVEEGWGASGQQRMKDEMAAEQKKYLEKIKKEKPEAVDNYNAWTRNGTRGSSAYDRAMQGKIHPSIKESTEGNEMKKEQNLKEGEVQQASAIVTAKTMVDRVARWIEELSGMENDTLLELGDSIRDEMGQEQAKQFISAASPAINDALTVLKTTREELATAVRTLTGEEQPTNMLGAEEPGMDDMAEPAADLDMDVDAELDAIDAPEDEFAAADAAAGGAEAAGRMKRESIYRESRMMKILAG